jgi:hypothetical protein
MKPTLSLLFALLFGVTAQAQTKDGLQSVQPSASALVGSWKSNKSSALYTFKQNGTYVYVITMGGASTKDRILRGGELLRLRGQTDPGEKGGSHQQQQWLSPGSETGNNCVSHRYRANAERPCNTTDIPGRRRRALLPGS